MLGLGSSCNSEEGYAKGERYRERFHTGGTYNHAANPIGKEGLESSYIGGFSSPSDDDLYATTNAGVSIGSGTMRVRATSANGFASISVNTIPYTSYTISYLNDPNDAASGCHSIKVGTTNGAGDLIDFLIAVSRDGETISYTFNAGDNKNIYISWSITASGRFCFVDNISFKEV